MTLKETFRIRLLSELIIPEDTKDKFHDKEQYLSFNQNGHDLAFLASQIAVKNFIIGELPAPL